MKSFKIAACILSLLLVPVLMDSCVDNCTGGSPAKDFTINDMFLSTGTSDGTKPVPHSIKTSNLVFNFEMSVSYANLNHTDPYKGTMGAYACDPVFPSSKNKFTSLKITADKTLTTNNGQTFTAGSDLSALFLLTGFNLNQPLQATMFHFTPVFSVSAKSEYNFTFAFTLDDNKSFSLQSGFYELIP